MKRVFCYVVSTPKCGTTRLSESLANLGYRSFHEKTDVSFLYPFWTRGLFKGEGKLKLGKYVRDELRRMVEETMGDEDICMDISHYLSWFYPVIETLGFETRVVHITREPTRLVEAFLQTGRCGVNGMHLYGGYLYPPSLWELHDVERSKMVMSMFTHWCRWWVEVNRFFLQLGALHFRVEDFNERSYELLNHFLPEATMDEKIIFNEHLQHTPSDYSSSVFHPSRWSKQWKEIYNEECGEMLLRFGYKLLE